MNVSNLRVPLLVALLGAAPGALAAQDRSAATPLPDSAMLALEREVFSYPQFARRNPFRPLLTAEAGGPRFEQLRLLGIIYSDDPSESVALFGVGKFPEPNEDGIVDDPEAAQGKGIRTYRLHRGDVLGNSRVIKIRRMEVTVEVEEFGLTERRVMALPKANEGGTS